MRVDCHRIDGGLASFPMATIRITNAVLLQHMQGMKSELKQDIKCLGERIDSLENKVTGLEKKVDIGFENARLRFEDAHKHREALQEDLNATILMVGTHDETLKRHGKKLARV